MTELNFFSFFMIKYLKFEIMERKREYYTHTDRKPLG